MGSLCVVLRARHVFSELPCVRYSAGASPADDAQMYFCRVAMLGCLSRRAVVSERLPPSLLPSLSPSLAFTLSHSLPPSPPFPPLSLSLHRRYCRALLGGMKR